MHTQRRQPAYRPTRVFDGPIDSGRFRRGNGQGPTAGAEQTAGARRAAGASGPIADLIPVTGDANARVNEGAVGASSSSWQPLRSPPYSSRSRSSEDA